MARGSRQTDNSERSLARFCFRGGLAELLVSRYRAEQPTYRFRDNPGIKDAIEAMGVPHTEVDVILVNGVPVDFGYRLQDGDSVAVYPVFSDLEVASSQRLSPHPPEPLSFVLDVHLGKLARRLRLLGFDACYRNDFDDAAIMAVAETDARIILTRDLGILKHRRVRHGYLVRSDRVEGQLQEILRRYHLYPQIRLWARCMVCNGLMVKVAKADILDRLEARTSRYYDEFHRCTDCDRLYWRGSHYAKITAWLDQFIS